MAHTITTRLVKIGNSQGVRIPKLLLEQVGLNGDIQIEVDDNRLILSSVTGPRQGWEEQFQRMSRLGDDALLDGGVLLPTEWEKTEWDW